MNNKDLSQCPQSTDCPARQGEQPADAPGPYAALKTLLLFLIPIAAVGAAALICRLLVPAFIVGDRDIAPFIAVTAAVGAAIAALYLTRAVIRSRAAKSK